MHKYLIYMASGNGSRFGSNKLLADFHGKPLFQYGLQALRQAASREPDAFLLVVSRYPEIRACAEALGIPTADSKDSFKGASYTIKAALQSLPPLKKEDVLLFAAADQPFLSPKSVCRLLKAAEEGALCARLFSGETPGNPVLFSACLAEELKSLTGDQGGGVVAKLHNPMHVPVENSKELWDIDRVSDLLSLEA